MEACYTRFNDHKIYSHKTYTVRKIFVSEKPTHAFRHCKPLLSSPSVSRNLQTICKTFALTSKY